MTPEQQRAGFIAVDGRFVERLGNLGDRLGDVRIRSGRGELDAVGLPGRRLTEHAVHAWDVEVTVDPAATIEADAVSLLVDRLPTITVRAARAGAAETEGPFTRAVRTGRPERHFVLTVKTPVLLYEIDGGHTGPGAEAAAALGLPAEPFLRLVCGRLDGSHRPQLGGENAAIVDRLWRVFPGF
jgi:hypothetical protein